MIPLGRMASSHHSTAGGGCLYIQISSEQFNIAKQHTLRLRSRVSNSLSRPAFRLASAILCLNASIFCSFLSWSPCSTYFPALLNWSFLDLRTGALSSSGAGEWVAAPAAYGLSTGAAATAGEARDGVCAATLALARTEVNLGAMVL